MEYILISLLIGLLGAKAVDNTAPKQNSKKAWLLITLLWPLIILVIALKGRNHEESNPGC